MGLLKKLTKQKKTSTKEMAHLVTQVMKMGEMGLISLEKDYSLHIMPEILQGKSPEFVNNWYKNILCAWFVIANQTYSAKQEMKIFDKEDPAKRLGTFTIVEGMKYWQTESF